MAHGGGGGGGSQGGGHLAPPVGLVTAMAGVFGGIGAIWLLIRYPGLGLRCIVAASVVTVIGYTTGLPLISPVTFVLEVLAAIWALSEKTPPFDPGA